MAKNIPIEQQGIDLQELLECCDNVFDGLSKSNDRLIKIIEVKKRSAGEPNQGQDVSDAIANLKKINAKLTSAISEIKQLDQQTLLLVPHFGLRSDVDNASIPKPNVEHEGSVSKEGVDQGGKAIYMQEQEKKILAPAEIAKKTKKILDGVLAEGDWEHSPFLKAEATKLHQLRAGIEKLLHQGEGPDLRSDVVVSELSERRAVPPGYSQVFILLYQANDTDLQSWYRTIKTLTEHSISRPAYKDENHVQEFIRSKTSGIEHNGYAVVNIKKEDFCSEEAPPVDAYGHQLFVLKENSIKLENIVEFVHANKKHYALSANGLVLLDKEPAV